MAAKIDQEFLKKHHFWLLQLVILLGLALAWFGLLVSVPESIATQANDNKKIKDSIDGTKAQAKATVKLYDERKQLLFDLRSKRWKEMWDIQKGMYEWPTSLGEDQIAKTANLIFGDEIKNVDLLDAFKNQYAKDYETLAKSVKPLQFNGGWQAVLRHVSSWRLAPESEEVWLALEDLWIQRELIKTIANINDEAAKIHPVNPTEDPAKTRTRSFQNRTWKVDLELVEVQGGFQLKGKIKNVSDRLQAFGATNELVLKVWLSDDPNAKPFEYVIEGTSLEGGKEEPIKFVEKKHKIFEGRVVGLYRVEQVFDARTVPIKRIDKVGLGYTSARHSMAELDMTPFSTKIVEAAAAEATSGTLGSPGGPGGPGGPAPAGPSFSPDGSGASGGVASTDFTTNGLARRRYVNLTDQVRSMPIGLMLVCDQLYSAEVLTALANSRLRMQIVQSHLNRFRGSISYFADATTTPGTIGVPPGGEGPATGFPPRGGPMPPMAPGGFPGSPGGFPGGPGGFPGSPAGFPGGPGGFPGSGAFGAARSSSEDMVAGNLIEFSVYGIASLYEKFKSPESKDGTPGTVEPTKEAEPEQKTPATVNPDPKTPAPVTPDPKTPAPVNPDPKTPAPVTPTPAPVTPDPKTPVPPNQTPPKQ